ncbi:MAG: acyl-CoA dehydratase activase-related protein [bacterium]|nr:acyl-CoA dehydratase activase-related protein [bacterium]
MESKTTPKTIGIPRAISYFSNYPFYYGYFKGLGIEIVLSDKTTNATINNGCKHVVSDTCLPIKVFIGHVINLLDKGCETIFVPSLQSSAYKVNNCSKIRGLPEIVRNVINRKITIIDPEINKTEGISFKDFCLDIARRFDIYDSETINSAIKKGWETYNNFHKMTVAGLSYKEALQNALDGNLVTKPIEIVKPLSVVIMAHGYNLFDERISMGLIKKLEKMGVKAYTSLNITTEQAYDSIKEIGEIQYWANELELTGTAAYYMLNNRVDGIIALSAFGCGPDSLMVEEVQYHAKERGMSMIHLNIDEHTGEAGFVTRLEAFVDMMMRKKRKQIMSSDVINLMHTAVAISKKTNTKAEKSKEEVIKI